MCNLFGFKDYMVGKKLSVWFKEERSEVYLMKGFFSLFFSFEVFNLGLRGLCIFENYL